MWLSSFLNTIYWWDCPFSIVYFWLLCCKLMTICMGFFLWSLFYSIDLCVCIFMAVPYCFNYCSFVIYFKIKPHDTASFALLSQDCFGYLGLLCFHRNFKIALILWKFRWSFDKDYIESVDCFREYGPFNNINSSNPWAQTIFPLTCVFSSFFH